MAGLSPENVVVVVNADSVVSRTIANHYIDLRQIPTKNVVLLSDVPTGIKIGLEPFREKILKPLLEELDARGIANRVRTVAYSADFPTAVRVPEHRNMITDPTTKKYQGAIASITGLTFFYRYVLEDNPAYLNLISNLYARGKFARHFINPFSGEPKEKFDEATKLMEEESFEESAAIWKELFGKYPLMPSLAIRAAETYSKAENDQEAIKMIRSAIRAGWWSARYLKETPSLDRLLEDPAIAKSLQYLDDSSIAWQGPEPFVASVGWTLSGCRVLPNQGGLPYLSACSLAVVHPRGSTIEQAVSVFERATNSDRTYPKGLFMFGESSDVRTKTRMPVVPAAMVYLQENGFDTRVYSGAVPKEEASVLGMMTGAATLKLTGNPWVLVPGAISENLTSYGGAFDINGHTKITEFLRVGSVMSSGAVAEPYSLPTKFPSAMLYGYYAKGMSAMESFYLSVQSPYQLLIVGDPLAQPFARAPAEVVDVSLVTEGKKRLQMTRRPLNIDVPQTPTRSIEISIDDRLFKVTPPVPNIDINWPDNLSGVYDVRATLTGLDRSEPRITFLSEVDVQGPEETPVATLVEPRKGAEETGSDGANATAAKWELSAPGADKIELMHLGEVVATVEGESGTVTVETDKLGGGPLRFRPVATVGEQTIRGHTVFD